MAEVICDKCHEPIDKTKGWHMSEGIDPETSEHTSGIYHWDCLGDYGDKVNSVLQEMEDDKA